MTEKYLYICDKKPGVSEFEFPAKLVMKVETKGTKKIYSVFVIANYHGVQMTLPINDAEAVKEWIRIERSSEAE